MSDPIEQLAAKLSAGIWRGAGMFLGQTILGYTAHAAMTTESRSPFSYIMSWLNPFTVLNPLEWIKNPLEKAKKAVVFSGLEAGAYPFYNSIATNWDKSTPIAVKFMTPIIATSIRPVLETLRDEGFISLYNPQRTRWYDVINPWWLGKNLVGGTWNAITWPANAIGNWWNGSAPRSVYQVLEEVAPKAGRLVANGIETSAEYMNKSLRAPSDMIQAIAQATGLPYGVVLVGTLATVGFAAFCLKSGWNNITNTINFSPKINAHAIGNHMGGVHIHLDGKGQNPPILHAATKAQAQALDTQTGMPPVTIVTGSLDGQNAKP